MTRLEVLKAEKEQIKGLRCLSFGLIDKCIEWYDKEIEAIVIHGADNKFYGQQADDPHQTDMDEAWEQAKADRNEFYNWDAPIRHKADVEYILKSEAIRVASGYCHPSNIAKELEKLPSVDIPPEHDGCKDCRWQSQSETKMPCKQCKHNYTDEWEREKPTDTITMTREEFSEKLMEHYRQGRADEKAYQNGEIMQSFNPD